MGITYAELRLGNDAWGDLDEINAVVQVVHIGNRSEIYRS